MNTKHRPAAKGDANRSAHIHMRVEPQAKERIKKTASDFGFKSLTDYVLWLESFRPVKPDNPGKWRAEDICYVFNHNPFTFLIFPDSDGECIVDAKLGGNERWETVAFEYVDGKPDIAAAKRWCAEWARGRVREIMLVPDAVGEIDA
jgi:hypothetical protein